MATLKKEWFASPVFAGDEEKTRQASLLNMISLTGLSFLGLIIPIMVGEGRARPSTVLVDAGFFLCLLAVQYLLRRGRVSLAGMWGIASTFTWVTMMGISQGTIRTPATASYVIVVVLAGMLFEWRGILVSISSSSLAILGMVLAENAGRLPPPDYHVTYIQWITYTCLFGITASLSLYNHQVTRQALGQAKKEITERKQVGLALEQANRQLLILQDELREQALRDPLTGLYNRRCLKDKLPRDLEQMKNEGKPLSVVIMDIDHFKHINDTCGHTVGDQFLIAVAQHILGKVRQADSAYRYGGEEFVLVIPGASAAEAYRRADELRETCAGLCLDCGGKNLSVTISVGIAAFPAHGTQAEELLINADRALYHSKNCGRNCVTLWDETLHPHFI